MANKDAYQELQELKQTLQALIKEMDNFINGIEYVKKGFFVSLNTQLSNLNEKINKLEDELRPKASKEQIEKLEK